MMTHCAAPIGAPILFQLLLGRSLNDSLFVWTA